MSAATKHDVVVRVLKHDSTEHRRWSALLAQRDGPLIVLDAEFTADVSHELLGEIKQGTRTVEYYWLDCWYNVFRFLQEDGTTRLWYCNINTPPEFRDGVLTYIDLDIDILVRPDFSFQVLDMDEFETNAQRYGYSHEEKQQAQKAVYELINMIETHQFPFAVESSSVSVVG